MARPVRRLADRQPVRQVENCRPGSTGPPTSRVPRARLDRGAAAAARRRGRPVLAAPLVAHRGRPTGERASGGLPEPDSSSTLRAGGPIGAAPVGPWASVFPGVRAIKSDDPAPSQARTGAPAATSAGSTWPPGRCWSPWRSIAMVDGLRPGHRLGQLQRHPQPQRRLRPADPDPARHHGVRPPPLQGGHRGAPELVRLSLHDALTGLPNRMLLADWLAADIQTSQRRNSQAAVLFVDLDKFKHVNDTHGHEVGDRLMRAVADRLRTMLRPEDRVIRFGGDEFVVLCPDINSAAAAEKVANRVIEIIEQPFTIGDDSMRISASVGVALAEHRGVKPEDVLRDADVAMYQAKAQGSGPRGGVRPVPVGHAHPGHRRGADPRRPRGRRVPPPLPAGGRDGDGPHRRRRGPPALDLAGPRHHVAGRVHPDPRGDRPDRPGRDLGARGGLPRGGPSRGDLRRPEAAHHHDQRLGPPARPDGLRRQGGECPAARRRRCRPDPPRDHRGRPDARRVLGLGGAAPGQGPRREAGRSTTSAPATRRSRTSGASASTC